MRVHISEEIFLWRQGNIHVHRIFFLISKGFLLVTARFEGCCLPKNNGTKQTIDQD